MQDASSEWVAYAVVTVDPIGNAISCQVECAETEYPEQPCGPRRVPTRYWKARESVGEQAYDAEHNEGHNDDLDSPDPGSALLCCIRLCSVGRP